MPSQLQEPDNYSADEILERLRGGGRSDEPELVTRPDGTQVVKVRKRKRRSHQPHKEAERRRQRRRIVQIVMGVVLVLLLAGGVLSMFAYYNSRGFVDEMRDRIQTLSGADVEFKQFRVTPVSAGASAMSLSWPDGNPLRELKLQHVSGDLRMTSFFGRGWSGEEVLAKTGKLRFGAVDPGGALRAHEAPASGSQFPFAFLRYRCEKLALMFGAGGRPPLQVNDVEASYYILPTSGQLRLLGGEIVVQGWPKLQLERGLIEYRDGQVEVTKLRLGGGLSAGAFAEIEGIVDPVSGDSAYLDVRLEQFPLQLLAGEPLGRLLSLDINSDATLSFVPGRFDSYELVVPFAASPGTEGAYLTGLSCLEVLRNEFPDENIGSRDRSYSTESVGLLRRTADGLAVEQLRLEQKNMMAVRGEIRVGGDNKLTGELDVGVAERLALGHRSPMFRKVFSRVSEGYWWATVRLSGTVQRPQDDLAETIKAVLESGTGPGGGGGGGGGGGDRNERLEGEFRDLIEGGR